MPEDLIANNTVDSVTYNLPYADWFDQGATVEFTFDGQLPSGFGTQYMSSSTINASLLKVESPSNVESNYIRQYTIAMLLRYRSPRNLHLSRSRNHTFEKEKKTISHNK